MIQTISFLLASGMQLNITKEEAKELYDDLKEIIDPYTTTIYPNTEWKFSPPLTGDEGFYYQGTVSGTTIKKGVD